jgi:ribonucleotide reductase beta subunit family protein with ferritin-like domain
MMTAHTHTNFFEGRATEYSKGGIKGWETGFNFLTKGK